MEFKELVEKRRSIRAYVPNTTIPTEELESMIECALQAPSWKNSQTARYYIANTAETFAKVKAALPEFNQNSSGDASAYIVTTFVKGISGTGPDGSFANCGGEGWGAYDLGLSNAYMLLKATELGYDSLIMGIRDGVALKEIFGISDDEQVMAVISIGKKNGDARAQARKSVADVAVFK